VAPLGASGRATVSRGVPYSLAPAELARLPKGVKPVQPIAPPRGGPGLDTLDPSLARLVRQCFVAGHIDPRARPLPEEWEEALNTAEDALVACNLGHFYSRHLARCPECQAQADAQRAARPAQAATRPMPKVARPASAPATASQTRTIPWPNSLRLRSLTWSALAAALRPAPAVARASITCRDCGRVNPGDEIYCQNCARRLAAKRACPHCARAIPSNAHFCPKCGRPV